MAAKKYLMVETSYEKHISATVEKVEKGWTWSYAEGKQKQVFDGIFELKGGQTVESNVVKEGAKQLNPHSAVRMCQSIAQHMVKTDIDKSASLLVCYGAQTTNRQNCIYGPTNHKGNFTTSILKCILYNLTQINSSKASISIQRIPIFNSLPHTNSGKVTTNNYPQLKIEGIQDKQKIDQALQKTLIHPCNSKQMVDFCHVYICIEISSTTVQKIIQIVDLVDPQTVADNLPFEYNVLYQDELHKISRLLCDTEPARSDSTMLSLLTSFQRSNRETPRLILGWLSENQSPSIVTSTMEYLYRIRPYTVTRKDSTTHNPHNELIFFHQSEIQLKRKEIDKLKMQVTSLENNIAEVWSRQIHCYDNKFLQSQKQHIIKSADRKSDLQNIKVLKSQIQTKQQQHNKLHDEVEKLRLHYKEHSKKLSMISKEHSYPYFQLLEGVMKPRPTIGESSAQNLKHMKENYQYSTTISFSRYQPSQKVKKAERKKYDEFVRVKQLESTIKLKKKQLCDRLSDQKQKLCEQLKQDKQRFMSQITRAITQLKDLIGEQTAKDCSPEKKKQLSMLDSQIKQNRTLYKSRSRH